MIKKKEPTNLLEVDLTGPDGNAFQLIGLTRKLCQTFGIDYQPIIKDMLSSDYEHLIRTFDRHFGSFVTLYR